MPWKDLLEDNNLFPTWSPYRSGSRLWSNKEIGKFLESGIKANRRHTFRLAQDALDAWRGTLSTYQSSSDHQPLFDSVVQVVSQVRDNTNVPGCKVTAKNILKILQEKAGSGVAVDILANSARTTQVTNHLLYIIDLCKIFAKLSATKSTGSLHCEAALGTLISTPVNETHPNFSLLSELQQYGRIIGTSKRCCPVCTQLLSNISPPASSRSFITRCSHRTITSCTLPDWTPPHIVEELIKYFGEPLRQAIGRLKERTHWAPLKYSPSTGSSALSVTNLAHQYPVAKETLMKPKWT